MLITASVYAEDDFLNSCDYQGFSNTYYLLDKKDFAAAGDFFLLNDLQFDFEVTDFLSLMGQRDRITTFYDFGNHTLLETKKELLHTLDNNLPDYRSEKEQIIYIDRLVTPEIVQRFEVKKYNKKTSPLDKHPLFSRIKRKERSILIDHLSTVSKDSPESISESLKIESIDKVHLISLYGVAHAAATLSHFTISNIGVPNTSLLLKTEIFYDTQGKLNKDEKEYLNTLLCHIDEKFQSQFPHIKHLSWFGYAEYNELATSFQPSRELFRKYPALYSIGQIVCLAFIGFLLIYLILGRYSRQDSHVKISKINHH